MVRHPAGRLAELGPNWSLTRAQNLFILFIDLIQAQGREIEWGRITFGCEGAS